MKTRLFFWRGYLAFSFWTRDLKTALDKKAVCKMIGSLSSSNGVWINFKEEDLDDLLMQSNYKHLGIAVVGEDLTVFDATPFLKKYDELQELVGGIEDERMSSEFVERLLEETRRAV